LNDPVNRVIRERETLERGFSRAFFLSLVTHFMIVGLAVAAPLILPPKPPPLKVVEGIAVPLPPGGGGRPDAPPPAPAPPQPEPPAPRPEPEKKPEPQKILKPPKEVKRQGLPEPDARSRKRPTPEPTPQAAGAPGGTGRSSQLPGLEFLPPGPGVPGGTDLYGDWYLAGVQRKIWTIWTQQIRSSQERSVTVQFTIRSDGSVEGLRVVSTSGVYLLDQAAQRAVLSATPFGPLPRNYGTDRLTIQAVFKPTP
jgi:protein TonB